MSLLACQLAWLVGCTAPEAPQTKIGVGQGNHGGDAEIDAGNLDGGDGFMRPAESVLPPAEQTIKVPYLEEATTVLELDATLGRLDVLFSVDTTSSMGQEIDLLQKDLLTRIIPSLRKQVADVAFGVSRFEDFPQAPFGNPGTTASGAERPDEPFHLLCPITQDESTAKRALLTLDDPLGFGGDGAEAGTEALFQIATGIGYRAHSHNYIAAFKPDESALGSRGGAGFRDLAMPLVVHITDAPSHLPSDYGDAFPGTHNEDEAIAALTALGARVIGVATSPVARSQLMRLAAGTLALLPDDGAGHCETGVDGAKIASEDGFCPLVFETDEQGQGLSDGIVASIVALLDGLRFNEVRAVAAADPNGFVHDIRAVPLPQPKGHTTPSTLDLRPLGALDGIDDTFADVYNSARLGFEVRFKNTRIAPTNETQSFRVRIQILGDGWVIDERLLRVIVPPQVTDQATDASMDTVDASISADATVPDAG